MARAAIVLEAQVRGCSAEYYVNDIPVARLSPEVARVAVPLNHLLVSGLNTVEMLVNPGPSPSTARAGVRALRATGMRAIAQVALYPADGFPGDASAPRLLELAYSGSDREEAFPRAVGSGVELDVPFPTWAWARAPALQLDAPTIAEATQVVAALHAALRRGQPTAVAWLKRLAAQEVASAFGESATEQEARVVQLLEVAMRSPGWALAPLTDDLFDFRLCARGRLIECVARDWDPVVRSLPDADGESIEFPMWLGRADGELRILR